MTEEPGHDDGDDGVAVPQSATAGQGSEGTASSEPARESEPTPDSDTQSDNGTDWRALLERTGTLEPEAVDALLARHGDRGRRAVEAIAEERVKQYRDFTVVVGHRAEYIVEDGACTCKDATYNLEQSDPDQLCWHALSVAIARRVDAVDHHDLWYAEVREFV